MENTVKNTIEVITAEDALSMASAIRDAKILKEDSTFAKAMESIKEAISSGKFKTEVSLDRGESKDDAIYYLKKLGYSCSTSFASIDINWSK